MAEQTAWKGETLKGKESKIQKEIVDAINGTGLGRCWVATSGLLKSPDGKRFVRALPEGFPDLFGYRKADGKMFFIEVKTASGRISKSQINFMQTEASPKVLYGIARSIDDAFEILGYEQGKLL